MWCPPVQETEKAGQRWKMPCVAVSPPLQLVKRAYAEQKNALANAVRSVLIAPGLTPSSSWSQKALPNRAIHGYSVKIVMVPSSPKCAVPLSVHPCGCGSLSAWSLPNDGTRPIRVRIPYIATADWSYSSPGASLLSCSSTSWSSSCWRMSQGSGVSFLCPGEGSSKE